MRVGVLALQGAFLEHERALDALNVERFEIRNKKDIQRPFDALILPGGESTTQGKLLRELDLFEPLQAAIESGLPVFGTCAGLLLLAKEIDNDSRRGFATMDIVAARNAYGRQLGSFSATTEFKGIGAVSATFIRAPYIMSVSNDAEILATVDGKIVAARQGSQLATAFHPELTSDLRICRFFLETAARR